MGLELQRRLYILYRLAVLRLLYWRDVLTGVQAERQDRIDSLEGLEDEFVTEDNLRRVREDLETSLDECAPGDEFEETAGKVEEMDKVLEDLEDLPNDVVALQKVIGKLNDEHAALDKRVAALEAKQNHE